MTNSITRRRTLTQASSIHDNASKKKKPTFNQVSYAPSRVSLESLSAKTRTVLGADVTLHHLPATTTVTGNYISPAGSTISSHIFNETSYLSLPGKPRMRFILINSSLALPCLFLSPPRMRSPYIRGSVTRRFEEPGWPVWVS